MYKKVPSIKHIDEKKSKIIAQNKYNHYFDFMPRQYFDLWNKVIKESFIYDK